MEAAVAHALDQVHFPFPYHLTQERLKALVQALDEMINARITSEVGHYALHLAWQCITADA